MSGLDPNWSVPNLPPFHKLFSLNLLLSFATSYFFFYLASRFAKKYLWTEFKDFKQVATIAFDSICGCWVFLFAITHPIIMFTDPVFYFKPWMKIITICIIGYLIHDAVDMLRYEISRWTIELLLHHFASGFVMSVAACGERFTVYAYWSLLMEVNSIFLHARTLFQLSGASETYPNAYKTIKMLNIITFVIFRFFVQIWQTYFVIVWRTHFNYFYYCCGFYGGLLFLAINTLLFARILAADGYLGSGFKKRMAINRDEQKTAKAK
ncbi:TLC domain-containing protein [Aphelenchoides bicaudatus]|nr:TLC domain-containing protein [Aphelenchoides bicaudatus]